MHNTSPADLFERKDTEILKRSCRFCSGSLGDAFLDLGSMPLANAYLRPEALGRSEPSYPLRVFVCPQCFLTQLSDFESRETLFNDHYAYFSSCSTSWLDHASRYVNETVERFHLNSSHQVIEIASNDGYLLQYFQQKGIAVLGVEPSANVAQAALQKGIPTVMEFFGVQTANDLISQGKQADLLIGNNVLAHVPDPHDLVGGIKRILKPTGIVTMEFPHLLRLIENNQFDTIYHEHFSYFTLHAVEQLFKRHGLTIFDVKSLPTHGGSIRIYAHHAESGFRPTESVKKLKDEENAKGVETQEFYQKFSNDVLSVKKKLLVFLNAARREGKIVAGYGAPAKANTFFNFCGITAEDVAFTVDVSPAKQGYYLPGSRIPIFPPDRIRSLKPDYLLILPWNLREEIQTQMAYIREWGGRFAVAIPRLEVW